jgi:hypothetical protein
MGTNPEVPTIDDSGSCRDTAGDDYDSGTLIGLARISAN